MSWRRLMAGSGSAVRLERGERRGQYSTTTWSEERTNVKTSKVPLRCQVPGIRATYREGKSGTWHHHALSLSHSFFLISLSFHLSVSVCISVLASLSLFLSLSLSQSLSLSLSLLSVCLSPSVSFSTHSLFFFLSLFIFLYPLPSVYLSLSLSSSPPLFPSFRLLPSLSILVTLWPKSLHHSLISEADRQSLVTSLKFRLGLRCSSNINTGHADEGEQKIWAKWIFHDNK